MPHKPDALHAYIVATADALGIPREEAERPGVAAALARLADMAALLDAAPLEPTDEPAGRYEP